MIKRNDIRFFTLFLHPKIMSPLSMLIGWQIISFYLPPHIIPPPLAVGEKLLNITISGELLEHLGITLYRILLGFAASMGVGIAIGLVMGIRRYWESFFMDYINIALAFPAIAWAVIATMWFGLTLASPTVATFLITFPYIAINIWEGVKAVDKSLVEMAHAFKIPRRDILLRIVLPSLIPFLFAAIRYGFAISWKIVTIAEMFAASSGIGYMIVYSYQNLSMTGAITWTFLFAIIIILVEYLIFKPAEKRVLKWRPEVEFR